MSKQTYAIYAHIYNKHGNEIAKLLIHDFPVEESKNSSFLAEQWIENIELNLSYNQKLNHVIQTLCTFAGPYYMLVFKKELIDYK